MNSVTKVTEKRQKVDGHPGRLDSYQLHGILVHIYLRHYFVVRDINRVHLQKKNADSFVRTSSIIGVIKLRCQLAAHREIMFLV